MVIRLKISCQNYYIKSNFNSKIVLLSDIHYDNKNNLKHLYKVLNKIKKINPNYICIAGDFINRTDVSDISLFFKWLKDLGNITKVIIGIGNHDMVQFKKNYDCRNDDIFLNIKAIDNVYLLDNTLKVFDNINFIGLTLPWKYYYIDGENPSCIHKYIDSNLKVRKDKFNILLCHSPYAVTKCNDIDLFNNSDLILSGHMHAGCLFKCFRKLFKGVGIFSPVPHSRRLFSSDMYGYIKNKNLIISSGITKLSDNTKIKKLNNLFDSEITIINIEK